MVDTEAECSKEASACGNWWGEQRAQVGGGRIATSGRIWIKPHVNDFSPFQKQWVIAHELGHALGLGHDEYNGAKQVMYPVGPGTPVYRPGDKAGFAQLKRDYAPQGAIEFASQPSEGKLRVS